MTTKTKVPGSIFIDVREWRDKMYGNSYYSAIVSVDGVWQFTTGMAYGYGDQAVYEVAKELQERGLVPEFDAHGMSFTYQCREAGISLYVGRRDVLKRELPKKSEREE
jgi:hypothetical protein